MTFDEIPSQLQSNLVTVRKKALDSLIAYLGDATIRRKIDSKTDSKSKQLTWNILLRLVHDAISKNVARLKFEEHASKAKGYTRPYKEVLRYGDGRGERIRANDVVATHIMDVLLNKQLCKFVGKNYLTLLSKYILVSAGHCSSVSQNKWMNLAREMINVWSNGDDLLPPTLIISTLSLLLTATTLHFSLHDPVIFTFYTKFVDTEWLRHVAKNTTFTTSVINVATCYCNEILRTLQSPDIVIDIATFLIPKLLRPNHALLNKVPTMEFISVVLSVWTVIEEDEREGEGEKPSSTALHEVIIELNDCVLEDLENIAINPHNASGLVQYYAVCAQILHCYLQQHTPPPLHDQPATRRPRTRSLSSILQDVLSLSEYQRNAIFSISENLVKRGAFNTEDVAAIADGVLKCLKNTKNTQSIAESALNLLHTILSTHGATVVEFKERDIWEILSRSCLSYNQRLTLRLLPVLPTLDLPTVVDIYKFEKPTWANIEFIEQQLDAFSLDTGILVNWLLRGVWKESSLISHTVTPSDWRGCTCTLIGGMLARLCGKANTRSPDTTRTADCEVPCYSTLQFADLSSPPAPQPPQHLPEAQGTVDMSVVETIRAVLLEVCMKLSVNNTSDMLLKYCTVVHAMLSALKQHTSSNTFTEVSYQFHFLEMYLKNINLSADLYPHVLELAKVVTTDMPISWLKHFMTALKDTDCTESSLDSEDSMLWENEENRAPAQILAPSSRGVLGPSNSRLPSTLMSSTFSSSLMGGSTMGASQYMADNEEAYLLNSQKSDPAEELKIQIIDILYGWCGSAPDSTVEILNLVMSLCEHYTLRPWTQVILHILRTLATLAGTGAGGGTSLPLRFVEMLPEVARLLLTQYYKDDKILCSVLEVMSVLLGNLSAERHCHVIRAVLTDILARVWNMYEVGKMPRTCCLPFISCVSALLTPSLLPSCQDILSPVKVLSVMCTDRTPAVRVAVLHYLPKLLATTPDQQLDMFYLFCEVYDKTPQVTEDTLQDKNKISDISRSYLVYLTLCITHTTVLQLPALHKLVLCTAQHHSVTKGLRRVCGRLGYDTPATLFSVFSEQVLLTWVRADRPVAHFPFQMFGYHTQSHFYREQAGALCTVLLLEDKQAELQEMCSVSGESVNAVLTKHASFLLAGILPSTMPRGDGAAGEGVRAYACLLAQLGGADTVVREVLRDELAGVVAHMCLRLHDPVPHTYSKYHGADTVVTRHPTFQSHYIRTCIEWIRDKMKESKKPGIFKLLALSKGGIQSVLLDLYKEVHNARDVPNKRNMLTSYQFVVDMLVEDEHNTISTNTDWCYLATDIVVTVTTLLHDNNNDNNTVPGKEKITAQCYDILLALLTALPSRYTMLGSAVTGLVRELHRDTGHPDKVGAILEVLLADCKTPAFLPVVQFADTALHLLYSKYTTLPVLSQNMLQTVRQVEGAYWYLHNLHTPLWAADGMVVNTAINTLLQSQDKHVRQLLGKLDIDSLDISLVDTMEPPDSREWGEVCEDIDEYEYIGIITDIVTPYLFHKQPATRTCAHVVLRNILRSNHGKQFCRLCLKSDHPNVLNRILPFCKTGSSEAAAEQLPLPETFTLGGMCMLSACKSDVIRHVTPLASLQTDLPERMLGIVLHDLLSQDNSSYRSVLSQRVAAALRDNPKLYIHQAIQYLASKPIAKNCIRFANYNWLDLDYLLLCESAVAFCQYTLALSYLEIYTEQPDDTGQLARCSSKTSAPQLHELLLDIYLNLQCSDAINGTRCNTQNSKLKIALYKRAWYDLQSLGGLAGSREHLLTVAKHTDPNILLPALLSTFTNKATEDHYEAAWRNAVWELPSTQSGLHGNIYSSLLSARSQTGNTALLHVERAQRECQRLKPQEQFVYIQLLNEIANTCSSQPITVQYPGHVTCSQPITVPPAGHLTSTPGRRKQDFRLWEPVYQARSVISAHITKAAQARTYLDCARAARLGGEFDPANRFLKYGLDLGEDGSLKTEECELEWARGERSRALLLLDTLLSDDTSPLTGELLLTKARWLEQTNKEFPNYIMENCLETAVEWCVSHDSPMLGEAHLELALFADEQYKQQDKYLQSSAYKEALDILQQTEDDLTVIKQQAISNRNNIDVRKQHSNYTVQVNQDKARIQKRESDRLEYLLMSVKHYLLSLKLHTDNALHVFRLCSLLLDNTHIESVCSLAEEYLPAVPSHKLLPPIYQLAARLGTTGHINHLLRNVIMETAQEHPFHVLPILFALKNAQLDLKYIKNAKTTKREPRTVVAGEILMKLTKKRDLTEIILNMDTLTGAYVEWANFDVKEDKSIAPKVGKSGVSLKIPSSQKLTKLRDVSNIPLLTSGIPVRHDAKYPRDFPTVVRFQPDFKLVGGVNLPKLTFVLCSDGVIRKQLVKGSDDLRQDSVMQQVFGVANQLLSRNPVSKDLHMKTYNVLPLSQRSGLVEWCENTEPIGLYLVGLQGSGGAHSRYRPKDPISREVRSILNQNTGSLKVFKKQCERFRPVFRHYFIESFPNPCEWLKQRNNYTYSLATSSIVGHIVGLGDRHPLNILIDKETSELIHIDLGVAFDQGKLLRVPETVPFRLTRDLVDALGITGTEGAFRGSCEHVMRVLHENKELFIAIIEVFIHDPLYNWCIDEAGKRKHQDTTTNRNQDPATNPTGGMSGRDNKQAHRVLASLKSKLLGIEEEVVLGVEGQINHLIRHAQDPANLCKIYTGWQSWI